MAREPTAAQALYPHLPGQSDYSAKQQQPTSLANAMWPGLSEKQKALDKARARDEARRRERNREMAKDLRDLRIFGKIKEWR